MNYMAFWGGSLGLYDRETAGGDFISKKVCRYEYGVAKTLEI